jgi:hypothetical protein
MEQDPFLGVLRAKKAQFVKSVKYYNYPEPKDFVLALDDLIAHMHETEAIKDRMHPKALTLTQPSPSPSP